MNRSVGARYLPLAAIVAIQLLIVAVAPSNMERQSVDTGAGGFDPTLGGTPGIDGGEFVDPDTGVPVGTDDGVTGIDVGTDGSSGGSSDGSGSDGGVPGNTGTNTGNNTGGNNGGNNGGNTPPAQGDTSHCKGDRQFDPAIDFYAPPCVGKFAGQNPGQTYQGVTGDEIKIVQYYGAGDPAVNAILQAQGAFVTVDQYKAYNAVAAKFINENYELYGRKVKIELFEGTCRTIPPDEGCIQGEFEKLVQNMKPFAVVWNTSLCSNCFKKLSQLKVVNLGGWNFRDSFGQDWRPYHYDVTESGTRLAQHAGRFWCNQLTGHNAEYSRNYKDTKRALGVIATNDPQNQQTVEIDLKAEISKCGQSYGNRKYFYEQDISTADQQRRAGVLAMRGDAVNPNDDATSVMCFCDLVAPAFLYQEEDTQQYYPENIVTGTGFMDTDAASQAYIGSVGCPQGKENGCAFDGAFGFKSTGIEQEKNTGPGHRVWVAGGGGKLKSTPFESADLHWSYLNLIASSAQMAGPNLTPESFEQGAFRLGARGDATNPLRQITPGNYHWTQDVVRAYWSRKPSPYNGKEGRWIHLDQQRTRVDGWKKGKLQLPAMPR